jgi:hypothetical protein
MPSNQSLTPYFSKRVSLAVALGLLLSPVLVQQTGRGAAINNPHRQPSGISLKPLEHTGMCDASAAVALDGQTVIVASDEDNKLRIYSSEKAGPPLRTLDISSLLRPDPKGKEADIEGATWLDGRIFWITSHSRNKKGNKLPSRYQLFALKVKSAAAEGFGKPYTSLLEDLAKDERYKKYELEKAAELPAESPGGLNVEGLCATPLKSLLIGLRNPIPNGSALIVPLENPTGVLQGQPVKFGAPVELKLGGLGIRSLEYWKERNTYLIAAGPFDDEGPFRLYRWSGGSVDTPQMLEGLDLSDLHVEGLVTFPKRRDKFQILSDDGDTLIGGEKCKDLGDDSKKRFRSDFIAFPAP